MWQLRKLSIFLVYAVFLLSLYNHCSDALPFEDDDRLNEISRDFERKTVPLFERLFGSAEAAETVGRSRDSDRSEQRDNELAKEGSKHARTMIASVLSFIGGAFNFGKTIIA